MRNKDNIGGNYYDKHNSKNPIVKFLMNKFHFDLLKLIKQTNAKTILDVGCGEGYTTNFIYDNYQAKIKCIELETKTVSKAKKIHPHLNISKGSIYNLKFKNNSFDLVLASEVLEHLEDPIKGIKEAKRVAKKYCLSTVPNEPLWRIANMARGAYLKDFGNTPGHINHWSRWAFKSLLQKEFNEVTLKTSTLWNLALCKTLTA